MIETNRLFGASHFTFYNFSSGPQVDKVLRSYAQESVVEVLGWQVPVQVDLGDPLEEVEIHYFAQLAAMNDCLYRNMLTSRWLVFTDLDEVVAPLMHRNWVDMLRHASAEWDARNSFPQDKHLHLGMPGSYLIRNIFLPTQWNLNNKLPSLHFLSDEDQTLMGELRLKSVMGRHCEATIFPYYIRSKYIVWARVTEYVAVHQAYTFVQAGLWQVQVASHTALLYHYRNVNDASDNHMECSRIFDFLPTLLPTIIKKYKRLFIHS